MRAVITGVAGFIGSHLAERLIADGWTVTGIDSFAPYYDPADKEENLRQMAGEPRFDLVRADICAFPLDRLLRDRPAVIHLAAQAGVRGSFGEGFAQYVRDNVLATQTTFEAARDAGCQRVVYASSSSVYGEQTEFPCTEQAETRPQSPYGVTKQTCEQLADVYRGMGLEVLGLRYFTVYGPRQRPDMAIRKLCELAVGGPSFRLFGDGSQSRDFTYVTDAVDATVRALTAAAPEPVLNVGGGEEATMSQIITRLEREAGCALPVEVAAAQLGDVRRTGADTSQARRLLGWAPHVGLAEGLRRELEWVRQRAATRVATHDMSSARAS